MNRRALTKGEFNELKELAEELAYSPTKADGANAHGYLEFQLSISICPVCLSW